VFVFLACITVALVFSFKLTLVMLSTGIPSALILWFISRFLDPAIDGQQRELAEAAKHATAATTAIDVVKVYNGEDCEAFNFLEAIRRSARYYARQILCNCGQMSYIKFWMIMLFVLGFWFAVDLASRGDITPGNALTTFYAILIAFQSLEALGPQWLILAKGMAAGQLLKALVLTHNDGKSADKINGSFVPSSKCVGTIEMTNISFVYPSNPTKLVLTPSNFQFSAGQLTFVVGRSGSGKSTLANLLLRFYEPRTGSITVDGHPLASLDLDWLRRNITLVQQSSVLFNDTFFKNVALGAENPETVTAAQVYNACNMALLQTTIASLPEGLTTAIGPSGYSLSGGQRQRLALARAKLRDPPVLILDEVTSGLDPVSRTLIMDAIRVWRRDKITIIITHEVGHIGEDEFVYVIEDGKVVQEGFRRDLAGEEGLFSSLLASADVASESVSEDVGEESYHHLDDESDDDDDDNPDYQWRGGHSCKSSGLLHALGLDSRRPSSGGLFHRISFSAEQQPRPGSSVFNFPIGRQRSSSGQGSLPRRGSEAAAMDILAQACTRVHSMRPSNARRSAHLSNLAEASMDSLELFFLERLAKPKDRKARTPGPKVPSLRAILKTVWSTLDVKARIQLILGLISCVVIAGSDVGFAFIFAQLLSAFWRPEGRREAGAKWATYLTVVAAVDGLATFLGYFFMEHVAQRWVNTLRAEAIKRILAQPKSWFDKPNHSPSRISQTLNRNGEEMRKLVGVFVPIVVTVTFLISASLIWALAIRWDLTLVTLAGLPLAIGTARANSIVSDKWESACDVAANATASIFSDAFSNVRVVRALTLEKYFGRKHTDSAAATYRVGVKRAGLVGVFYGLYQSMSFFITALVFYFGAKLLSSHQTTVTDVLRVINLVLFSLGTSVALLANLPQVAAAKTTAVALLHLANLDHTSSHEKRGGGNYRLLAGESPLPICMTNLKFAYPSAPRTRVLHNINLTLYPGTCTAIVGASGCGKSTLAGILLRLYPPEGESLSSTLGANGANSTLNDSSPEANSSHSKHEPGTAPEITPSPSSNENDPSSPDWSPDPLYSPSPLIYNTHPATSLSTPALRTHMSYLPQHPFLFPTSIYNNITYGLHETSPYRTPFSVTNAAILSGIHEFIVSLPQGYHTLVGEGGLSLSGGQAQRICLARALVRHPKVVVLDEPTSALDANGAEEIRQVLKRLSSSTLSHPHAHPHPEAERHEVERHEHGDERGGVAVVVITHSKEMMRISNKIIMLEGGRVVESGNYEELVWLGGRFAQLVSGGVWVGEKNKKEKKEKKREEALRALEGQGSHSLSREVSRGVTFREVKY